MHRILAAVVLAVLTGCRVAPPVRSPPTLGVLLEALGLERKDVSLRGDRLLDPDRLELNRRLLERPLDTATEISGVTVRSGDPVRRSLMLAMEVLGDSTEVRESSSPGLSQVLSRAREVFSRTPTMMDLFSVLHPDSNLTQPELNRRIERGRAIDLNAMSRAALDLVDALRPLVTKPEDRWITAFGENIIVGTTGRDTFRHRASLILDPGGADVYIDIGSSGPDLPVSVVIDLGGDDSYSGKIGTGWNGLGVLFDLDGDDLYDGGDGPSQGAGIGGVGILWDASGNDIYVGGAGSQGFGLYGIGLLVDESGDDRYTSELLAQGASGPRGVGGLMDAAGNDVYRAGGRFRDFREEGRFYKSMAQGFSLGLRFSASGGVGLLHDQGGNDDYEVAYFGQGAAHWGGVGMLIDGNGQDRYRARRYAQGAGTHLAVGVLHDGAGEDLYSIDGVGQGCGHDLSLGVLFDDVGNDTYDGRYLCQGVGSANGIGILRDREGDDTYRASGADTQGHGQRFRDYGSIGLIQDDEGRDRYARGGARSIWISGSGGGVDR